MRPHWITVAAFLFTHVCLAGEPFIFDFSQGLPNEFFRLHNLDDWQRVDGGIQIVHETSDGWLDADIIPRFQMHGDFDIEVEFEELSIRGVEQDEEAGVLLAVRFADDVQTYSRVIRNQVNTTNRFAHQTSKLDRQKQRRFSSAITNSGCESGRLKITRELESYGPVVTQMSLEHGEVEYERHARLLTDAPTEIDGIRLRSVGKGSTSTVFVWKSIRISADKLIYTPPQDEKVKRILYVMDADGTNVREVTKPLSGMTHLGSPEWSADGKRICFDISMGQTNSSHIASVKVDGTDPQDHGPGCMPSFSPDNEYLVYSSTGVMRSDVDATFRESLDPSGWGVQWSPDGQYIAYAKAGNIVLLKVDTEARRMLLNDEQSKQVGHVYWNLGWSHDSKSIAFKSRNKQTGKYEILVADIDSQDAFQVLAEDIDPLADFTFAHNNHQVIFALKTYESPYPRLVMISRDDPEKKIEEYPNLPEGYAYYDADFSPDGNHIAFAGLKLPIPVVWGE